MKRYAFLFILSIFVLSGCSASYIIWENVNQNFNIGMNDIVLGDKISHTIDFDGTFSIKSVIYNDALRATGYDLIILPVYTIEDHLFSTDTITITGYGAKLKAVK